MANSINLWAESDADLIGDDSTPTLTFSNSSSGNALKVIAKSTSTGTGLNIDTTAATITGLDVLAADDNYSARIRSAASAVPALQVGSSVIGSPTVAPLQVIASGASAAVLSISGVFISTASMATAANTSAFHIPVYHDSEKIWGFIAVSKGVI